MQNSQEKTETSSGDNSTENTLSKITTTTNQQHEITESTDTSSPTIGGKNAGEVKMCPMPACKNPVRRGRYCNSCQKRKESLNRTLAMEGIHLPSAKTRRGKKGPDSSAQESPEKVVRKQRKKQRNDADGASDDAESINHLMNQDDELRRRSAGVSISSLLSQPSPPNPLQVPPQLTSLPLHQSTPKMPTPLSGLSSLPTLTSMMGQVNPQMNMPSPRGYVTPPLMSQMAKLEEDRMSTLKRFDTIMVEFAGNDDEASQLLREYIQSAFGRRRLAVPSTM